MKEKIPSIILLLVVGLSTLFFGIKNNKNEMTVNELMANVLKVDNETITVMDKTQSIYTFKLKAVNASVGDSIVLYYSGLLDNEKEIQESTVLNYSKEVKEDLLPKELTEEGLFKDYYEDAYELLDKMSTKEKIGTLLLARHPEEDDIEDLEDYHLGGFVFYERDFKNKTEDDVKEMIEDLQKHADIPLLTAVDEEGGKIVRLSNNENLVKEPFKSSKELYNNGGFAKIYDDVKYKSKVLHRLGLNLNLAPVVDVSTNPDDYMYERSLGLGTDETKKYAKTVIEASKDTDISYTLKHFPGYGNNSDTHNGQVIDNRSYESILNNDLPPFSEGIKSGAEAVLVSHNIVKNIDNANPASLSPSIHNLLRNRLEFSGIIITDDLDMGATKDIENATTKAILAGNDLIITTDYKQSFSELKKSLDEGIISEDLLNRITLRVLAWKYYKGLMDIEETPEINEK